MSTAVMDIIDLAAEQLRELDNIEATVLDENGQEVYTLAAAIRSGSRTGDQATTWATEDGAMCALSAALADVKSRTS